MMEENAGSLREFLRRNHIFNIGIPVLARRLAFYAFIIPIVIVPIVFVGGVVTLVVMLMFFIGAFVALSLVQFNRQGADYDKATQLKSVIRFWILVDVGLLLVVALLMYPVFKFVLLKHVVVMGLTIANWLTIFATLFSLYILDFVVNTFLHFMPPIPLEHNESGLNVQESCVVITDCVFFLLAEHIALNRIPWFEEQKVVGLFAWKWIEVTICITIGYNCIIVCTHLSAWLLRKLVNEQFDPTTMTHLQYKSLVEKLLPRQYLVYYANGLKWSINFSLSSLLILLTWIMYFKSHVSTTPIAEAIVQFGTRTWLSILICSVLWFCKACLVLSWEDTAMYTRFRSEILETGSRLYFLGILGRHSHDIFKLTYYGPAKARSITSPTSYLPLSGEPNNRAEDEVTGSGYWFEVTTLHQCCMDERVPQNSEGNQQRATLCQTIVAYISCILELTSADFYNRSIWDKRDDDDVGENSNNTRVRVKKLSSEKRKIAKYDLLMHHRTPTMHDVKQVSQYLISAKKDLSDQTFVSSILDKLNAGSGSDFREKVKQLMDDKTNNIGSEIDGNGNENAQVDDWAYFQELLKSKPCSKSIRNWLENAQDSCLFIGNALSSAKEVVECLNKIISCSLIATSFILWLLLTGLASTAVFVLVASPLLAATFIFGETCKTLFQGIVFVYVVHPIHVGDLCSVDDHKMVVKAVGVWTTTFCRVDKLGSAEEVSYPNSELSKRVVINHLTEFDWEDVVECNLTSLHSSNFSQVIKTEIEKHLKEVQHEYSSCGHSATVKVAEDVSKITINLRYKISDVQDWSYLQCVRRKKKLQDEVNGIILKVEREFAPSSSGGS